MAKRGFLHVYRTYNFLEKDPVIGRVKTLLQDEGLFKSLGVVSEISNVSRTTMTAWFDGETKNPRHATVAAIITACGYEETFVKKKDLDIEKERKDAKAWLARQERNAARPKAPKPNGKKK